MDKAKYMKVQYKHIPEDIRVKYNLQEKVTSSNYIHILINKGMYGIKQAAILAYDNLKRSLEPFRYTPVIRTVEI